MTTNHRSGQALVEFLVGLVAILTILACVKVGASMLTAHTKAMREARREADEKAFLNLNMLSDAAYIRDVIEGADQKAYTRDDTHTDGDPLLFNSVVVEQAADTATQWGLLPLMHEDHFATLRGFGNPSAAFGLVKGTATENVNIQDTPAVKHLFYGADSFNVRCDVWMSQFKDIY